MDNRLANYLDVGMPPPNAHGPASSTSKDLVPARPAHVTSSGPLKTNGADRQKPSTARALVLRNGKHGARGGQELMIYGRMSGREKLELLAGKILPRF